MDDIDRIVRILVPKAALSHPRHPSRLRFQRLGLWAWTDCKPVLVAIRQVALELKIERLKEQEVRRNEEERIYELFSGWAQIQPLSGPQNLLTSERVVHVPPLGLLSLRPLQPVCSKPLQEWKDCNPNTRSAKENHSDRLNPYVTKSWDRVAASGTIT